MELSGLKVLVTGGSSGLGLSLAKILVSKGADVHITGRNADKLSAVASNLSSDNLTTHLSDVSDSAQIDSLAAELGRIDVLINNAGIWLDGDLKDNKADDIQNTININLTGLILTTQTFLMGMIAADKGIIVNVSSTSGLTARPQQVVYSASKWGVTGFTDSLKQELKGTGITVIGVYPGGMKSDLFRDASIEQSTSGFMNTDDVAQTIINAISQADKINVDHIVINRKRK